MVPNSGTTLFLSDAEFALVTPSSIGVAWTDNGQVDSVGDDVSVQAVNVAALAALGTSNAAAATAAATGTPTMVNAAAITSAAVATANADATYGQPEADLINEIKVTVNADRADLAAVRTQALAAVVDLTEAFTAIDALITDVAAIRTKFNLSVTDLTNIRSKVNTTLANLTGTSKAMAA
jgi:hypothetical protein